MASFGKISRLVTAAGALTALGVGAVAYTGSWEGKRNTSYRDVADIWTICYGATRNVGPGMHLSDKECDQRLLADLREHEAGMRACLKQPDALPDPSYKAFLDLTFNIGVGAFCRSTARKRLDAGDLAGACVALTWFDKAGGRTIPGLVARRRTGSGGRTPEYKLCMEGVK